MPLKGNVRYRYAPGGKVRLAFRKGEVVEAKNMDTGKTHTPAEFAADRKKKKRLPTHGSGELTPLGQRTLGGYIDRWGDESGRAKFHSAADRGLIDKLKMFTGTK
jgi:hypothetical protein